MRKSLKQTIRWLGIILLCTGLQPMLPPDAAAWDNRLTTAVAHDDLELARRLLKDGFAIDVNQWGHTFGRSRYTQKEVETYPFHQGQTRRHEVDLRRYYQFDRPGTYTAAVSLMTNYWTNTPLLRETGPFPVVVTE